MFRQKISPSFIFSGALFLICMSLDFYMTTVGSQGDFTLEANPIGRLWWQLAGSFRFIEIPIWATAVIGVGYAVNSKSKYLALVWLNFVALNHFLGFLTWLPYGTVDFLFTLVKADWARGYAISAISLPSSLVFSFLQTRFAIGPSRVR